VNVELHQAFVSHFQ
jgi:hypothetical protein